MNCKTGSLDIILPQHKKGIYTVIRTESRSGRDGITDKILCPTWRDAVNIFALKIKQELDGCTWEIICPDGQIRAEAEF